MKVINVPDPILTKEAEKVKKIDSSTKHLIKEMEKTLLAQRDPMGVGLSAPQVGVSLRIFIMRPTEVSPIYHFINPEITDVDNTEKPQPKKTKRKREEEGEQLEGCLSIPKIWAPVIRDKRVKVRYQTLEESGKSEWFEDITSVVVQHEIDHLFGILFTQRALEQGATIYQETNKGKLVPMRGV